MFYHHILLFILSFLKGFLYYQVKQTKTSKTWTWVIHLCTLKDFFFFSDYTDTAAVFDFSKFIRTLCLLQPLSLFISSAVFARRALHAPLLSFIASFCLSLPPPLLPPDLPSPASPRTQLMVVMFFFVVFFTRNHIPYVLFIFHFLPARRRGEVSRLFRGWSWKFLSQSIATTTDHDYLFSLFHVSPSPSSLPSVITQYSVLSISSLTSTVHLPCWIRFSDFLTSLIRLSLGCLLSPFHCPRLSFLLSNAKLGVHTHQIFHIHTPSNELLLEKRMMQCTYVPAQKKVDIYWTDENEGFDVETCN